MGRIKRDTDYAYAVARVRANELSLLTEADLEQLIVAESYKEAMRKLSDLGWGDWDGTMDYPDYIESYFDKTWCFLTETLDDIHELDLLILPNDMQNLKATLKNMILQHDTEGIYTNTTVYDTREIAQLVKEKRFEELPEFMIEPVKEAYAILVSGAGGQKADAVIDRATLKRMQELAEISESPLLMKMTELRLACADIKVACRCAKTGKSMEFIKDSLVPCNTLSLDELAAAACDSPEAVLAYVDTTDYAEGAEKMRESTSAFEKWMDDTMLDCVSEAKYTAFGIDPVVAYYLAREAEIKSARIILSAKKNNLSESIIRERVRALYV